MRIVKPDIVLLDINLPDVDVPEAARQIWEEHGRDTFKVVAVSASTLEHETQGYLELGFDAFVPKPFRTEELYACLAEQIGVEYEYAEESVVEDEAELDGIQLPEKLLQHLQQAAQISNVTDLEEALDEVEKQSPASAKLADHLRSLSQDFKMDEVLGILSQLSANTVET